MLKGHEVILAWAYIATLLPTRLAAIVVGVERGKGSVVGSASAAFEEQSAFGETHAHRALYAFQLLLCFCASTVQHWSQASAFVVAKASHHLVLYMAGLPALQDQSAVDTPVTVLALLLYSALAVFLSAVALSVRATAPPAGKFRRSGGQAALFSRAVQTIGSGRMRSTEAAVRTTRRLR